MPHLDNYDADDVDDGELPEETFEQREAARLRAEAALDREDERTGRAGGRRRLPGALEGARPLARELAALRRQSRLRTDPDLCVSAAARTRSSAAWPRPASQSAGRCASTRGVLAASSAGAAPEPWSGLLRAAVSRAVGEGA